MDIRKFMKLKNISDRRSVESNSDKRFQNWVLFNQSRLMREPQTYLLIVQVHFRLICVNMRQFSKRCNGWQKVHLCGKLVYSFTWKRFHNRCDCFHGAFSLWSRNSKAFYEYPFALQRQQPKKISKRSTFHHSWKNFCGRPWLISPLQQALTYGQVRLS